MFDYGLFQAVLRIFGIITNEAGVSIWHVDRNGNNYSNSGILLECHHGVPYRLWTPWGSLEFHFMSYLSSETMAQIAQRVFTRLGASMVSSPYTEVFYCRFYGLHEIDGDPLPEPKQQEGELDDHDFTRAGQEWRMMIKRHIAKTLGYDMTSRLFPLGDILTVVAGRPIGHGGIEGADELCAFMTATTPASTEECRQALLQQMSWLDSPNFHSLYDKLVEQLDAANPSENEQQEPIIDCLSLITMTYGEVCEVYQITPDGGFQPWEVTDLTRMQHVIDAHKAQAVSSRLFHLGTILTVLTDRLILIGPDALVRVGELIDHMTDNGRIPNYCIPALVQQMPWLDSQRMHSAVDRLVKKLNALNPDASNEQKRTIVSKWLSRMVKAYGKMHEVHQITGDGFQFRDVPDYRVAYVYDRPRRQYVKGVATVLDRRDNIICLTGQHTGRSFDQAYDNASAEAEAWLDNNVPDWRTALGPSKTGWERRVKLPPRIWVIERTT